MLLFLPCFACASAMFFVSLSPSLSPYRPLTVLCEIDVWIGQLIELQNKNRVKIWMEKLILIEIFLKISQLSRENLNLSKDYQIYYFLSWFASIRKSMNDICISDKFSHVWFWSFCISLTFNFYSQIFRYWWNFWTFQWITFLNICLNENPPDFSTFYSRFALFSHYKIISENFFVNLLHNKFRTSTSNLSIINKKDLFDTSV